MVLSGAWSKYAQDGMPDLKQTGKQVTVCSWSLPTRVAVFLPRFPPLVPFSFRAATSVASDPGADKSQL